MKSEQQKQKIKEQRERICRLDDEILSYQSNGLPKKWGEWVYGGIMLVMLFIPASIILEEKSLLMMTFIWTSFLGPMLYLTPYMRIREQGKTVSYMKKIRYLPLDIKQVKMVRIGYLAKFLKKIVIIASVCQVLFGTLLCGQNVLMGIFYAVTVGGIIPLMLNAAVIWIE